MAQHTVIVKCVPEHPMRKEWIMDAVVRPGQLVDYLNATRIQILTEPDDSDPMFTMRLVVENADTEISATYASGDTIPFIMPQRGDEVMCYATYEQDFDGTIGFGATMWLNRSHGVLVDSGGTTNATRPAVAIAYETISIDQRAIKQLKVEVL